MAKWWLISWTTYATWLPGDERGYCTWRGKQYVAPPKRYAKPGEATYEATEHTAIHELAQSISDEPVHLNHKEMEIALAAMVNEIAEIPIVPAIMSLGEWHVHWLCYFGKLKIRPDREPRESCRDARAESTWLSRKKALDKRVQHEIKAYTARVSECVQICARASRSKLLDIRVADRSAVPCV